MQATVVITTKNRKDELRKAIESALMQTAKPVVLVIDDGSTDGTGEMVHADYPSVRLHRDETSRGLIVQRNRAASLVDNEIIFSIDDDAAFSTPHVVQQTLDEFNHPRVGAVAIPFINVNQNNVLVQRAPGDAGIFVTFDYIGTAHALRRDLFLQLGGYREYLHHQGEERDLCIRLLDKGYVVRLGRADPIHHYESPRRDLRKMDLFGRRNDVLFAWYNLPWRHLPSQLFGTSFLGIRFGFKVGRPLRMMQGVAWGYGALLHEWFKRKPVSTATSLLFRRLKRSELPLEAIEPTLRAMLPD